METKMNQSDHDLLIQLHTQYGYIERTVRGVDEKMTRFLTDLEKKADVKDLAAIERQLSNLMTKADLQTVLTQLKNIDDRVKVLENGHKVETAKKEERQTILKEIKEWGAKGWTIFLALITFIAWLVDQIAK